MKDFNYELLDIQAKHLVKAKNLTNNHWVYGFYIPSDDESIGYIYSSSMIVGEVYEIDNATVCNCTTLKDRNGDYIFENDLVCLRISYEDKQPLIIIGTVLELNYQWCIVGKTGEILFALPYLYSDDITEWNVEVLGSRIDYQRKI